MEDTSMNSNTVSGGIGAMTDAQELQNLLLSLNKSLGSQVLD